MRNKGRKGGKQEVKKVMALCRYNYSDNRTYEIVRAAIDGKYRYADLIVTKLPNRYISVTLKNL